MLSVPIVEKHKCPARMKFIENKQPDMGLVSELLEECSAINQWANFGPLYHRLANEYAQHMDLGADLALTPCGNAGIGLELLARGVALEAGVEKLRWVGSAFSFKNLGRGYFADMEMLDCDMTGLLDLDLLEALPSDTYDGVVVTNPFGMCRDFDRYIAFARRTGKKLLIDNAAGLDRSIPDWPWQVFSLHQTKPYGMGEGGLVLSPRHLRETLIGLINYDKAPEYPAHWLNNGKISDIACAFQIARLRAVDDWETPYRDQRARIAGLFADRGIAPLFAYDKAPVTNSLPMLFPGPFRTNPQSGAPRVDIARLYEPIVPRPRADALYASVVCFPSHRDMAHLEEGDILAEIDMLMACCRDA